MFSLSFRHVVLVAALGLATGCESPTTHVPRVAELDTIGVDTLSERLAALAPTVLPDTVVVSGVRAATARLEAVGDHDVHGVVRLHQLDGGVRVRAEVEGLRQTRRYGFQVLRASTCANADPDRHLGEDLQTPHGGPYRLPGARHVGDLGNIRGGEGDGRYDRIDPVLQLNGIHSPVRRAVVIRANADDATTQGGGAGEILACGVFTPSR